MGWIAETFNPSRKNVRLNLHEDAQFFWMGWIVLGIKHLNKHPVEMDWSAQNNSSRRNVLGTFRLNVVVKRRGRKRHGGKLRPEKMEKEERQNEK